MTGERISLSQIETPKFFKIGNIYLFLSGIIMIMGANITPFVYGTFLNLQGVVCWSLGMVCLYLNYRIVNNKSPKESTKDE